MVQPGVEPSAVTYVHCVGVQHIFMAMLSLIIKVQKSSLSFVLYSETQADTHKAFVEYRLRVRTSFSSSQDLVIVQGFGA